MPALEIPIRANLDDFKKSMNETSSLARTAARKVAQSFLDMNKELASGAAAAAFSGMASDALKITGRLALVIGAAKLMGDAIGAARQQLADMVELQGKAQNFGVSSSFFQKFGAEAKKLQVDAADLEGALSHAFQATKDRAPIDLAKWETGEEQITAVEKALRVYNAEFAKTAGQQLQGLVLFRDADTQEKKVEAVLKAMIQLEQIGQRAASLDLGEKMFGAAFVDRIRQGRTSAESLLNTIQKASGDADGIFPDALVQRAKEMDDQLKIAHQRLSAALKPSWDDLADTLLTIKGYWADTVNLIAKAVELVNQIPKHLPSWAVPDNSLEGKQNALDTVNRRLNGTSGWTETYGILASRKTLEDQRDQLQSEIAAATAKSGEQYGPFLPSQTRGPGPAPTLKPTGSDTDKFETSAESIEKRTSALQAETAAIDLGTAAREKSKLTAQLETVAKQMNAAAGLGENVVTQQQRDRINEVASAYGAAALAMDKARVASQIKFDRSTAFLSPEDVQIAQQLKGLYPDVATALGSAEASAMRLNDSMRGVASTMASSLTTDITDMLDHTKSLSQGFTDLGKTIVRALEEAMVKMLVVAPIMRGLQGALGFSGGGEVSGGAASVKAATGGYISGPGTGTSDSIPARLSDGEFVVKASQTAKYLPLLRAINDNAIPRFADGGLVGSGSAPSTPMVGGQTVIAPSIAVTVQGAPGMTSKEHEAMGQTIAKAAKDGIRQMVAAELRNQMRPGGILRR